MRLKITIFIADQSIKTAMSQSTSAGNKVTINKLSSTHTKQKKSTISFKLHIPHYRQDKVYISGKSYMVELSRTSKYARCPSCGRLSQSLHGHYRRQLQAPEIFNHPLTLLVKTRKFRCRNEHCLRQVFSEDHSSLVSPYKRNTREVEARIGEVSLKTTSRIASELLHGQNIFSSPSSCLRSAHKAFSSDAHGSLPVAIGIDDFAQKKGHIYASVIVDQITHRPLAILPCRQGDELEQFLGENPQIQYITRDRGRCFVDAITRVLPGATQICDRFHLIKNLMDILTEEITSFCRQSVHKQTYSYPCMEACKTQIMETLYAMGNAWHRHKLNLFLKADNCIKKGMSISETACRLGVHSQLVYRLVRDHTQKDYMCDEQKSILKHADELAWEISHGCTDIKKLKKKMGNKMQAAVVSSATLGIRNSIKQAQREVRKYNRNIAEIKNKEHASVRSIENFILKGESSVQGVSDLLKHPSIKQLITLGMRFREMINGNPKQLSLEKWIKQAMECESTAMRGFAAGIRADRQAVQNAMDIYLSNGVVEGTVNKIKAIKRMMFNRASYKLLYVKLVAFKT